MLVFYTVLAGGVPAYNIVPPCTAVAREQTLETTVVQLKVVLLVALLVASFYVIYRLGC